MKTPITFVQTTLSVDLPQKRRQLPEKPETWPDIFRNN
jgi:hypothetical protein